MLRYSSLARNVIHTLEKYNDRFTLYRFITRLIELAKESPYCNFVIPIVELSEDDNIEPKYVKKMKEYNKANIGFRFTENCIISNKCSKKCYKYNTCKEEYEKKLEEENE